jgi:hypothetical protein
MRSFVYGLYILALSLSPSLAQVPCSETITDRTKLVNERTPGFQPVVVLVRMPVDGDVEAEAKKAKVTFSLGVRDPMIRNDEDYRLSKILQCTFTPQPTVRTDKVYLTARMEVVWEWNTADSYTLRTGFFLPTSLIQKRPDAQAELPDGTILKGEWGTVNHTVYVRQKGKRDPVPVQRQIAQLTLVAQ